MFNNHFHPGTLRYALEALEALGCRVQLPDHDPPAIRPALHHGMLKRAKRQLRREVERLDRQAGEDVDIVALEPSTVSVFRDDLHDLFPGL